MIAERGGHRMSPFLLIPYKIQAMVYVHICTIHVIFANTTCMINNADLLKHKLAFKIHIHLWKKRKGNIKGKKINYHEFNLLKE